MSEDADRFWREVGIAAPARRALIGAGILTKADLSRWTVSDLGGLHGIGRTAIEILTPWLKKG